MKQRRGKSRSLWIAGLCLLAGAALLSRMQARVGAGVSWDIENSLESGQTPTTQNATDQSHQTSSDGQELTSKQTNQHNSDGSSRDTQDLDYTNGKGDRMENHSTTDRDPEGNTTRHIEDSYTDPDGNKTTTITDETFDANGKLTGWKGNSKREKVAPPKRAEPKKRVPEEPETPAKPPKPPKPPGSGNKPQPQSPEGVQVTLSLQATPECQPGVQAVSVTATGALPLEVNPMGFSFAGNLTIQDLTTNDYSCPRTYYERATKKDVAGEWQVQIQKQNPGVFMGLTAIEPLGLGFELPPGEQNQQTFQGSVRAGRTNTADVIRGGRYDVHTATLQLMYGNMPGLGQLSPALALTRADLSDGFSGTYSFQGKNFVTVADAGEDRPQPFTGTGFGGALNTNAKITLKYKGGGRGPARQPPPAGQPGEGEEILGMVVIDEPPNRPGGVPGVLVKTVRKTYAIGPGAAASGDVIIGANHQSVTCVEDLKKIVSQASGKPVELSIVRAGKPMSVLASP